ncbi:DNA-binding anti-repressor SinI [Sinobaca sp. H24]|nr:DNA-binding anti-repressor SinI [Sinobaca sp. H24]
METKELDYDWMVLIREAKAAGMTKEEILEFFHTVKH